MPRPLQLYYQDIVDSIDAIQTYTEDMSKDEFMESPMVIDAVTMNLLIIAEATKSVPKEIRSDSAIEWRKLAGMRDVIAHQYFTIDVEIVWDVVETKLPSVKNGVSLLFE